MQVTSTFKPITYEEARYEFFLLKKHEAERKLQWYQKRLKNAHGHWEIYVYNMCCKLCAEISYYNDVLNAFEIDAEVE